MDPAAAVAEQNIRDIMRKAVNAVVKLARPEDSYVIYELARTAICAVYEALGKDSGPDHLTRTLGALEEALAEVLRSPRIQP